MKALARFLLRILALMWAVALLWLAAVSWQQGVPIADVPLSSGAEVEKLAAAPDVHDTGPVVRVEGTLQAEASPSPEASPSGPSGILLERVQVDSGTLPRAPWRTRLTAFLTHQQLPSTMEYDMVSPPRLNLVLPGAGPFLLQTEDINLDCWPEALDVHVANAYPADVSQQLLDTLPALPTLSVPARVRVYTMAVGQHVTVLGAVDRDGALIVLRPPDHYAPFVVSPLPYDVILSRLRHEQRGWQTLAALFAGASAGLLLLAVRRPRAGKGSST